jgi:hypothetical protein
LRGQSALPAPQIPGEQQSLQLRRVVAAKAKKVLFVQALGEQPRVRLGGQALPDALIRTVE